MLRRGEVPMVGMRRREFITLLGGAAAEWPLAARSEQVDRLRRIGVLTGFSENDPEGQRRVTAFLARLRDLSSASPAGAAIWRAAEAVAPALGVRLTMSQVRDGTEIERAVQDFAQQSNGGLVVQADPVTNLHRKLIISLAVQHRLPAVYS
jgi:hypothetical protein